MQHFVGDVFWMRSGKPYPKRRIDQRNLFQKRREGDWFTPAVRREIFRRPVVAVYVLAQQSNFLVPHLKQLPAFLDDGMRLPASFAPAGKRYHTKGAHIIA